jgi:hypothetical protein
MSVHTACQKSALRSDTILGAHSALSGAMEKEPHCRLFSLMDEVYKLHYAAVSRRERIILVVLPEGLLIQLVNVFDRPTSVLKRAPRQVQGLIYATYILS